MAGEVHEVVLPVQQAVEDARPGGRRIIRLLPEGPEQEVDVDVVLPEQLGDCDGLRLRLRKAVAAAREPGVTDDQRPSEDDGARHRRWRAERGPELAGDRGGEAHEVPAGAARLGARKNLPWHRRCLPVDFDDQAATAVQEGSEIGRHRQLEQELALLRQVTGRFFVGLGDEVLEELHVEARGRSEIVAESLMAEKHNPPSLARRLSRVGADVRRSDPPLDLEGPQVLAGRCRAARRRLASKLLAPVHRGHCRLHDGRVAGDREKQLPERGLRRDVSTLALREVRHVDDRRSVLGAGVHCGVEGGVDRSRPAQLGLHNADGLEARR